MQTSNKMGYSCLKFEQIEYNVDAGLQVQNFPTHFNSVTSSFPFKYLNLPIKYPWKANYQIISEQHTNGISSSNLNLDPKYSLDLYRGLPPSKYLLEGGLKCLAIQSSSTFTKSIDTSTSPYLLKSPTTAM